MYVFVYNVVYDARNVSFDLKKIRKINQSYF